MSTGEEMRRRSPAFVAGAVGLLAVAFLIIGARPVSSVDDLVKGYALQGLVLSLEFGLIGALVMRDSPDNILGPLLAGMGIWAGFGQGVAAQVLAFFAAPRTTCRDGPFPELTERETEVLERIAAGHNNERIARNLVLSEKTVRNHVSNIFAKLRVADRAEAMVRACEAGLGT